jgi:hypothetical protein
MPNQHLWGIAREEPAHGDQKKRKQSNWIRSIVAGAGMLAVSSLGAVLVFDWYFFSVVDGLSTSLQPIAVVFRQPRYDTARKAGPHEDRPQGESLFVPVRSTGNPKTN